MYCPCHNGAFSLADGSPTQGPPTAKLKRITVEVEDGEVFATGVEK
jgi:nitrite reductase/ring-hydroxylating ferredoxin subunit